jgi:pimeloyl-ACP methyl ester carboxylesterase
MSLHTAAVSTLKSTIVRSSVPPTFSFRAFRGGMQALARVAPEGAAAVAEHIFLTPPRRPRNRFERGLLETAHRVPLSTRYGEIAAYTWGDPAAPTVLLVHGWAGRGTQLGGFVEPLLKRGMSVAAFDAPAHGDSGGRRSSLFHFAEGATRAAEAFGPLRAMVTHSMGGAAALWACRDTMLAPRLALVASPLAGGDFTRVVAGRLGLPEDVRTRVHRRLHSRFGVSVDEMRSDQVAARMRGSLLLVHDEDDREVPIACSEAIARAWKGAELVRTRGLGHNKILRDDATLELVADFAAQAEPHLHLAAAAAAGAR